MTLTKRHALALAVALAAPCAARAASEAMSASAASSFQAAAFGTGTRAFRPLGASGAPQAVRMSAMLDTWDEFLRDHTGVVGEEGVQALAPTLAADLDLSALLNKQLKTSLRFNMGGKTVWCGGLFDRNQTAYLSVLIDGEAPRYYDVKGIYKHEEKLKIGAKTYKLWLSANIFSKLKSEIVFTNLDDENDETRFNLKKMLASVTAAGALVPFTGQPYRVFYTDGLRANQADPNARLFTFVMTDPNGDLHVYLIPVELVPSDRIAVFKMFADRAVGLTRQGETLKIYENP